MLRALESVMGERWSDLPMAATSLNTGYIESASILHSLGLVLYSLNENEPLWAQRTGLDYIDNRKLKEHPRYILALGSSDVGYNFAVVVACGEGMEGW